jgi:hypothetical protein
LLTSLLWLRQIIDLRIVDLRSTRPGWCKRYLNSVGDLFWHWSKRCRRRRFCRRRFGRRFGRRRLGRGRFDRFRLFLRRWFFRRRGLV